MLVTRISPREVGALLDHVGSWVTAGVGALAAVTFNNLPAAVLLSAHPRAYPEALRLGLNRRASAGE